MAKKRSSHAVWFVPLSFFCSYLLVVMPLPQIITLARPDWVALCLIFWILSVPERVGIFIGFFVGLLQDVLMGTFLGTFALAYSLLAYILLIWHRRLRMFPILQQTLALFFIILLIQLLTQWLKGLLNPGLTLQFNFPPAFASAIIWPWFMVLMNACRFHLRID